MAYSVSWARWKSTKYRKTNKVLRRWRRLRRTLSAACGSYRRPYSRPAIEADQKTVQRNISHRVRKVFNAIHFGSAGVVSPDPKPGLGPTAG